MIRFVFFLIGFLFLSQLGHSQSKEIVQTEQRLILIENLYQNGSYAEVIYESDKLTKGLSRDGAIPRSYLIKSKIYLLKANYSILEFEKERESLSMIRQEIESIINVQEKALSYLYLTSYYNEIGSFKEASEMYAKVNPIKDTLNRWMKLECEIEKAVFLIGQKYLVQARHSIALAEKMIGDSLSSGLSDVDKRNEQQLLVVKRAQVQNLKFNYLLKNGNFSELEKLFSSKGKLLLETLGRFHQESSKCLELEADLALERQQYKKAFRLYQEAYNALNTSDYQQHKIYLLSRVATLSVFLGENTKYDQYMRRLQLHADRNIHKYNYFQLAYAYADAYSYFVQADYTTALNKINKVIAKYPYLPSNHFFRHTFYELEATIYLEDARMSTYRNLMDTLVVLSGKYIGTYTPAHYESTLNATEAKMKSGEGLTIIEKNLVKEYQELVPEKIDSFSILSIHYLGVLAEFYFQTDRFALANLISKQKKVIAYELYSPLSWEYTLTYLKNIEYAAWAGNYKEASKDYSELANLDNYMKQIDNSFQYIRFHHFSTTGKLLGDFTITKTYSLRGLKLLELEPRNKRLVFSDIREQAAATYIDMANLFSAEKLLMQSLNLKKQKLGNSDPALLIVYKELARLYIINGNFTQSDKMLSEYLKISKQLYGIHSVSYNEGVFLSGQYYLALGDNIKAKEKFESCLKDRQNLLGEQSLLVASTYLELAQVNVKIAPEKFISNEKIFKTAGSIIESTIGKENQLYVQYLQLLAEFYISFAKYNLATEMLLDANRYWESKLGNRNVHSADIAMLMGKISYLKSNYKESETNYEKARSTYEFIFNDAHPSYSAATARLARVSYMLNEKEKSLSLMEVCIPKYLTYVEKYFPSLSFQEKSKFWFSMREEFEFYDFLVLSMLANSNHKLNGKVYNNVIATKALLLSSDIKLRREITSSGDTVLIRLFENWLLQKELLTTIMSFSKEQLVEQGLDQKKIELNLESLEKEMSIRSELFGTEGRKSVPTWKDIQASLGVNEYVVEMVRYRYFDKIFRDSVVYAALIIGKESKESPDLVLFPDGNNMEGRYLNYFRNAVVFSMEDEVSYEAFWRPIKSKIPDNARIYLSSEGVYNQLNVEMLYNTAQSRFVIDENQLVQLTNTKDLLAESFRSKRSKNLKVEKELREYILCGNPAFYTSTGGKRTVKSLLGAENEVKGLKDLLDKSGKRNIALLNSQVTEDTLKSFKNPVALHIATHGYFKETKDQAQDDFMSNPLLNSGLMLTGSGDILDNSNNAYVNASNGILTAYEVVNMQLDKTELVVLSACETGKGQLKAGEGVYGLQRSFLVAGANCVVLSLFKVNDEVTKELMMYFYSSWLQSNDKRSAFNEAKKLIKEKYKSPIFWGAFIMIEGKNKAKRID